MKMKRTTAVWAALAVAGLIVAVGVSYAASQLSKPSVGLTNEPLSAGLHLAPKPVARPAVLHKPKRHQKRRPKPAVTPPPVAAATPTQQSPVTPAPRPAAPAPRPAPAAKPAPARPRGDDHGGSSHSGSGGGDDGSGKDD